MNEILKKIFSERNMGRLTIIALLLGAALRIIFYLQNRSLFIDEANVARNIYERSFAQLTTPLSYEQYAPPLFLWIVKCGTLIAGFGELSLRSFPLICGILGLYLLYRVLKKYTAGNTSHWYPLFLMATGLIYIRYSAELKQYMCDGTVVLALLLTALNTDIIQMNRLRFVVRWCIIGSITIWLSMPGVFMLAGIGIYYAATAWSNKTPVRLLPLAVLGFIWLAQFTLYYLFILKPQIQSDYLQACHKDFFLYALPYSADKLNHNVDVLVKLLSATGGKWAISIGFHLLALSLGVASLYKRNKLQLLLLTTPVLLVLLAAALHQYALTPRLVLFVMPLLLVIIGAGVGQLLTIRFVWVRVAVVSVSLICINNFGVFNLFYKPLVFEEIVPNLSFIQKQQIPGDHLFVHNLAGPAYIYYTTIHPGRERYTAISGAHILYWNSNYDSLARSFIGTNALLYSYAPEDEISNEQATLLRYCSEVTRNTTTGSTVFIYKKQNN